jgi:hypothetical protein
MSDTIQGPNKGNNIKYNFTIEGVSCEPNIQKVKAKNKKYESNRKTIQFSQVFNFAKIPNEQHHRIEKHDGQYFVYILGNDVRIILCFVFVLLNQLFLSSLFLRIENEK